MNETLNSLMTRRSIKAYTDAPVTDDVLDQILDAGLYAPTGKNNQKVVMVAVRDKDTIAYMSRLNAAVFGVDVDTFYGAPCVVVVLSDPERDTWVEDGSLVLGNLMNAAHSLGLGSCWVHRARQVFDSAEGKALLKCWGLPETLRGIGNCLLGYAANTPVTKPRAEGRIVKI